MQTLLSINLTRSMSVLRSSRKLVLTTAWQRRTVTASATNASSAMLSVTYAQYFGGWTPGKQQVQMASLDGCCADQLSGMFTTNIKESLVQRVVPRYFTWATIVPILKNNKPSWLNNYWPVAFASVVIKVFERLLKCIISSHVNIKLCEIAVCWL